MDCNGVYMRFIIRRHANIFAMSRHTEHQYVRFSLSPVNYCYCPIETIGIKFKIPRHLSDLDLYQKKSKHIPAFISELKDFGQTDTDVHNACFNCIDS